MSFRRPRFGGAFLISEKGDENTGKTKEDHKRRENPNI